ncbi:MAG: MASE3 domain-containing protein, partial [Promethearchaeota archaeon]
MKITRRTIVYLFSMIGIISLFYVLSAYSYLLFHTITEFFTILVAFAIFIIIWNTRKHSPPSNFFLIIGISSLFVGVLDFFHALSYSGMGIFLDYDANLPTQLWIAARYMQSLSLLLAILSFNRKIMVREAFVGYTTMTTLTLVLIFTGIFPDCYVGSLTPFKIYSEYIIILILILVLYLLNKHKTRFEEHVYLHLTGAILFTIIAEIAFTFYVSVFGFSNFIGHIAKLISFILIYQSIIVTSLHNPFDTLFRDLKNSQINLRHERDQLARSNTMIQDFNKSLNVVNSILRHDLLSNLHSIDLSLELLKKQENSEPIQFAQLAVEKGVKLILSMQNMEILLSDGVSLRKIDICEIVNKIRDEN